MAERVVRQLIDDLDGSQAVETVRFGYGGRNYEIDLNEEHARTLNDFLSPYIEHARRTNGNKQRRVQRSEGQRRSREELRMIRQWARQQGLRVGHRGRVPEDILAKYDTAHVA